MSCDFIELAAPGVRALRPYQPGKPESELRREYGLTDIVKLASNENPLGPAPRALAAVQACLGGLARYPDGNGFELKAALAARLDLPPQAITLGNGSNDVLELVGRAFLTPDHEAVYSRHAFAVYPLVIQAVGARAAVAAANPPGHAMPHGHDLEAMAALVGERTRVVFIANPNNPTGTWLEGGELEGFLAAIPPRVLVVLDEAYREYVDAPMDSRALMERFPNLILTRTFSKAYGLAGLRVGYAASHPQVADLLNRVRQPFNVSLPAQVAALAALDDAGFLARSRAVNRDGMAQLCSGLRELGLGWLPSAGNFVCVEVGSRSRALFQGLLARGVIVRPVDNYELPDFLRVTVGTGDENRRFLEALAGVLDR